LEAIKTDLFSEYGRIKFKRTKRGCEKKPEEELM